MIESEVSTAVAILGTQLSLLMLLVGLKVTGAEGMQPSHISLASRRGHDIHLNAGESTFQDIFLQ